ncbi:MAG: hypothetical protein PHU85_12315 [Phycisphaerae bacterium]|nr:hypothetical protein [Phycisphaerae bacterium]
MVHRLCALTAALLAAISLPVAGQEQSVNMGGVQVWNADYWQTVQIGDFYGPNFKVKELKPISLVGVRNGTFSGFIVLANGNAAITNLKATASELVNGDKKIPADLVKVRYPEPAVPEKSWAPAYRFDGLLDSPPEEIPIVNPKEMRGLKTKLDQPVAFQPVWVTVKVPKDAAPGDYTGKLTIKVDNPALDPLEVAVKLKVHDWQVADPKDFTIKHNGWLLLERQADYYKVSRWSDKHFDLIGKTLLMMQELGSRQVQVNLVGGYPSIANDDAMVTFIKQKDGTYKHDLARFDKYMDVVAKTIGKPFPIRLNMWTVPRKNLATVLPPIKVLDPETNKVEDVDQPAVGTEEAYKLWKPVLDEIKAKLEKRGWFDATGTNWIEYCGGPTPAVVSMMKRIWGDGAKWTDTDHGRRYAFAGLTPEDSTRVLSTSTVWNEGDFQPRGYRNGSFKADIAVVGHARGRHREWSPLWDIRAISEEQIMKGEDGVDPLGGDFWPIKDPASGRIIGLEWAAFALGPGNCTKAFLAPGPDGPIATERFEAFREGVQIAEAILFIQGGLDGGKVSGDLAARANKVLDARSQNIFDSWPKYDDYGHRKFVKETYAKDAQAREGELFAVAAEVAKATGSHATALKAKSGPPPVPATLSDKPPAAEKP